jgi:outer membrane protein
MNLSILAAAALAAAPQVPASPLTLDEAVRLAEANQPALRAARADVRAGEARTAQARSALLPRLDASAQAARQGEVRSVFGDVNRFTASLGAEQLLWDFGQTTGRVAAARALERADDAALREAGLAVVAQVRDAFALALARDALLAVARGTLDNQLRRAGSVQAFVEVGSRPESDLAQARSEVAQARLAVVDAESQVALARAQLHRALGLDGTPDYALAPATVAAVAGEDGPAGPLAERMLANRPALQGAAERVRAQERSAGAARGARWPRLGAFASANAAGPRPDRTDGAWAAGVTLSWTLFDGGLVRAQVREADAALASLRAQEETARQDARLELEQLLANVRGAKAALAATGEAVAAARERLRLASARYESGAGTLLEVNDAEVAVATAAGQGVEAEYRLAQSRARLVEVLGG